MAFQLALKKLEHQAHDTYYSNFMPWQYCSDTRIPVRIYGGAKVRFTTKSESKGQRRSCETARIWGPPEQDIVKSGVKNQRIAAAFLGLPNVASLRLFWLSDSVKPLLDCIATAAEHNHYITSNKSPTYRGVGLDVSATLTIMKSDSGPNLERLQWLAIMPNDFSWTKENWEAFDRCCQPPVSCKHVSVWQMIGVIFPLVRRNSKQFPRSRELLRQQPPRVEDDDIVAAVICVRSYLIAKSKSMRQDWITTCDKQPSQTIYFVRSDAQPSQYWIRKDRDLSDLAERTIAQMNVQRPRDYQEPSSADCSSSEQDLVDTTSYAEACTALYPSEDDLFIDAEKTMRLSKDSVITLYKTLSRRFDVKFRSLIGTMILDDCGDIERAIQAFETIYRMAKLSKEQNPAAHFRPTLINVPASAFETWQMIWSSWFAQKLHLFLLHADPGNSDSNTAFGGIVLGAGDLIDELLPLTGKLHPRNDQAAFSGILVSHSTLPQLSLMTAQAYHSLKQQVRMGMLSRSISEKEFSCHDTQEEYHILQELLKDFKPDEEYAKHGGNSTFSQTPRWRLDQNTSQSHRSKVSSSEPNEEVISILAGHFGLLIIDEAHIISTRNTAEFQACKLSAAQFNIVLTSMTSGPLDNGCELFRELLFRGPVSPMQQEQAFLTKRHGEAVTQGLRKA